MADLASAYRVSTGRQGLSCPASRRLYVYHSIRGVWHPPSSGLSAVWRRTKARQPKRRRLLLPGPTPGADRAPAVARGILRGTKPLRAPRRDKERSTRGLGTALDDPLRGDVEEMPVDYGNEGLKLVAKVLRCPTLHQLGVEPHQMGIQDFAPNIAGIRPPVLWGVQRRWPVEVDPGLIPDRWDDQPWPALWLGRPWELQHA